MFIELRDFYLLTDILFSVSKITWVKTVKTLTTALNNLAVMEDNVKTKTMDVFVRLVRYFVNIIYGISYAK